MVAAVSNSAVEILRPSQSADARAVRNISSAESAHACLFVWSPSHSISSRRRKSACSLREPWTRRSIIHPVFQRPVENEHPFKPCDAEHA